MIAIFLFFCKNVGLAIAEDNHPAADFRVVACRLVKGLLR